MKYKIGDKVIYNKGYKKEDAVIIKIYNNKYVIIKYDNFSGEVVKISELELKPN
jgi:hypothetical protein